MAQEAIGVGLIGCGTVGGGVVRLLHEQAEDYTRLLGGVPVRLRRVLVRRLDGPRPEALPAKLLTDDPDSFFNTDGMPIVVEVAGGGGVIETYVRRALGMGKHVVTANKSLLAAKGAELYELAHRSGACVAFEASCGGGIPVLTALQFGLMANRINTMVGILNGTCNYILTQMSRLGETYDAALRQAQGQGFAEADPTLDVSGRDAAQKLAVLASVAFGVRVQEEQVACRGIERVSPVDIRFGAELGYRVKLLAIGESCPGAGAVPGAGGGDRAVSLRVHPSFVHEQDPLAQVHGSFNALSVYGHAVGHTMFFGRGAGSMPTASAVVSDVLNVASGWYPRAFAGMNLWPDRHEPARVVDPDRLESRFYVRVNALDVPGVLAKVSAVLGQAGISISSVLQHEAAAGRFVPVGITTHRAGWGALDGALKRIEPLDVIQDEPVCIPIVDLPPG